LWNSPPRGCGRGIIERLRAHLVQEVTLMFCTLSAAAQDRVRWFGSWRIVSKSPTATRNDFDPVGDRGMVRFLPVIAGTGNGDNANLSVFYHDGARNFRVAGNFTAAFKASVGTNTFESADRVTPNQSIRFATQAPATIPANTPFIGVTGEVQHYDWMTGCRIQFRLSLQRRFAS
jgi:hypothetical protein